MGEVADRVPGDSFREGHRRLDVFDVLHRKITGFLLIGLGIALVYRKIKSAETAVRGPQKLPDMIEAVGRAVSTQTVTFNRYMENISEKLTALQRSVRNEDHDGQ